MAQCLPSSSLTFSQHWFKEDPEYGQMLKRMWKGDLTKEDCKRICTRVIGYNGLELPTEFEGEQKIKMFKNSLQRNRKWRRQRLVIKINMLITATQQWLPCGRRQWNFMSPQVVNFQLMETLCWKISPLFTSPKEQFAETPKNYYAPTNQQTNKQWIPNSTKLWGKCSGHSTSWEHK